MIDKYWSAAKFTIMIIGISALCQQITGKRIGVCYGMHGRNLPPFKEVMSLCNKYNIQHIRLYKPNIRFLEALRGSRISIMLDVPNEEIPRVATSQKYANSWVEKYVRYFYNVNIRYIVVGNDISPLNNSTSRLVPFLHNAIGSIQIALYNTYTRRVVVSTSISSTVLRPWTHPVYSRIRPELHPFMHQLIKELVNFRAPLFVNLNIYLHYVRDPKDATLRFALFQQFDDYLVVENYKYRNLFDAMVDAMYFALDEYNTTRNLTIVVSEVGWPTAGGPGASIENAKIFNNNLIFHLDGSEGIGTPRWPDKETKTFISALFDEDLSSPEYKKHLGIFNKNKRPKYPITFLPQEK